MSRILTQLALPAGVWRNGTQYQAAGRWYDSNLVRWVDGVLRPIGGWRARTTGALTGKARAIHAWRDNSGARWIAVGTSSKLYAISESSVVTDITPSGFTTGSDSTTQNTGYGMYTYGSGYYGTPRPDEGSVTLAATWQFDNWGENLIAICSADGKIYEWDCDTGNDATAVTNAPTGNQSAVITEERFLMALGAGGDARKVQWSDQENNTDWTPSDLDKSGDFDLQTIGTLQCGRRVRGGTLLFTDLDVHIANYIGYPLVYGFQKVGSSCGVIGPRAVVSIDGFAFWMGKEQFYRFDGSVQVLPCEVRDYVFGRLNVEQAEKVYAFFNSVNSEVWWLYPAGVEVDSYVAFNYRDGHWMIGSIDRTCGVDRGVFSTPLMVGTDGIVYDHEIGFEYGSGTPYAESGPFEIGVGERVAHALKLIPDEKTAGDCEVVFKHRFYPLGTETTTSAYSLASPTSIRMTGRQISMKVQGAKLSDWRWGTPRIELEPGGLRG